MRRIITFKRYFADFMAKLSVQKQQKIARALSLFWASQELLSEKGIPKRLGKNTMHRYCWTPVRMQVSPNLNWPSVSVQRRDIFQESNEG